MQDNGTGYLNEEVDDTTGVARTSSATEGYGNQPDMFQSMQMQNGNGNSPFEMLPVNTGDKFVDEYNAMTNNIQAGRIAGINRMNYEFMFNSDFGGHGLTPYRDGMDQYMLDEYGRSKYDSSAGFNTMTKEAVKRHRADEQTNFVILANGLPRLGGRALATVGSLFGGMLQGLTNAFGGSEFVDEYLSPHAFATYGDKWAEFMNENVPVYSSQEDEDYRAEHPLFGMFSTGQGGADLIDNIGFTIGAVVGMRLAGSAGAAVSTGVAVQQLGTAIYKQIDSDTFDANAIIPLTMEVLGGAAGVGVLKAVPKAWREQIGMLSAGVISAVGEAEVEAAHAKKEFIDEKTAGINALNEQFKQESEARIRKEAMEASDKAYKESMALKDDESVARFNAGLAYNDVMKKLDKETAVANWDAIQAKNKVVQEAEKVSNLTRTLNIAILSLSNTLQFGKLMTGGLKTYRTMTNMSVRKEANKFAEAVYKSQLNSAKTAAERKAVKNNKDAIIASALRKWQNANPNTKLFDTNRSLTAKDVAAALRRTAITEGTEEMTQRMSSDAAKAKGEWLVDDYYQGLTNREAIRKAESSTMAAVNAALNCLTDESAWSEFAAGALMGVLGVPWLRSAKASRTTRGEEGTMTTTSHYRSPIFLQGGIYGELTKMMQERKDMAAMSERLNEAFTEKGIERLRDAVNRIAKHMQYEEDKKMFVEQWGSRYDFENAEDADILNFVELFQNSNNMPILRGLVMSMYNYDSIDDLLQLQKNTNEVEDGTGNVTGPYSGFNISHIDENSSDQQREYVESEAERMRNKIKGNAERVLNTIDTYEKARKELDWETNQGLTNKQLNCLAWYKTRMGMFDERSKSMYAASGNFFEMLRSNIDNIKKDYLSSMDIDLAALDKAYENAKDEDTKNKLDAQRQNYKKSKELFEEGFDELKKRLDESAELDDDIKKVRLLFAGNVNAQPQTRTASEYLAYMLTGRFTPEMAAWNRSNYVTGIALGMIRMSVKGETNTDENKKQFVSGVLDNLLTQEGYTEADRTNIDEYLRDIQRCQDAVLRFKDKYQLYKDNPYLMDAAETAMHEAERKAVATAERSEMHEAVGECKSVAELYDKIRKMVLDGKDIDEIDKMLEEMLDNGSQIVKQFLANQRFVKVFAQSLKDIMDVELMGMRSTSLSEAVIIQAVIDASMDSTSDEEILAKAKEILRNVTKSEDSLREYIKVNKLLPESSEGTIYPVPENFKYENSEGKYVESPFDALTAIRNVGATIMDIAASNVQRKYALLRKYSREPHAEMDDIDDNEKLNNLILAALGETYTSEMADGVAVQDVITEIGEDVTPLQDDEENNEDEESEEERKRREDEEEKKRKEEEELRKKEEERKRKEEERKKKEEERKRKEEERNRKEEERKKKEEERKRKEEERNKKSEEAKSEEERKREDEERKREEEERKREEEERKREEEERKREEEERKREEEERKKEEEDRKREEEERKKKEEERKKKEEEKKKKKEEEKKKKAEKKAKEKEARERKKKENADRRKKEDERKRRRKNENADEDEEEYNEDFVMNPEDSTEPEPKDTDIEKEKAVVSGMIFPAMSYFNLSYRSNDGLYIPNNRIVISNGTTRPAAPGEKSSFDDFFSTYEKLGVFDALDNPKNGVPQINKGDEVFFVVDAVENGKSVSTHLGLNANELSYDNAPIVWMCVRMADNTYQCVGSMFTNRKKLEQHGLLALYDEIVEKSKQANGKPYVHDKVAKIETIVHGRVETQFKGEERASVMDVVDDASKIKFAVNFQKKEKNADGTVVVTDNIVVTSSGAQITDRSKLRKGILHILVHDASTGKYVPMQCHVARFDANEEKRLGGTETWKSANKSIMDIINAAKNWASAPDALKDKMLNDFNTAFTYLNYDLALIGHHVHMDLKVGNTVPYIDISRRERDQYGNFIKVDENNYKREHQYVYLANNDETNFEKLRDALYAYGVPFRISGVELNDFSVQPESSGIMSMINDGFITVNIPRGKGNHTHGAYVVVNPKTLSKPKERKNSPKAEKKKGTVIQKPLFKDVTIEIDTKEDNKKVQFVDSHGRLYKVTYKSRNKRPANILYASVIDDMNKDGFYYKGDYDIDVREAGNGGMFNMDTVYVFNKAAHKVYAMCVKRDIATVTVSDIFELGAENMSSAIKELNVMSDFFYNIELKNDKRKWKNPPIARYSQEWRELSSTIRQVQRTNKVNEKNELITRVHNFCVDSVSLNAERHVKSFTDNLSGLVYEYNKAHEALKPVVEFFMSAIDKKQKDGDKILLEVSSIPLYELTNEEGLQEQGINMEGSFYHIAGTQGFYAAYDSLAKRYGLSDVTVDYLKANNFFTPDNGAASVVINGKEKADNKVKILGLTEEEKLEFERGILAKFPHSEIIHDEEFLRDEELNENDFKFSTVEDKNNFNYPKQDIEREAEAARVMMPEMTRDESLQFVDGLIETGRKGVYAQGLYMKGKIIISRQAVRGTLFHEGFHMIFDTALKDEQKKDLLNDVRRALGRTMKDSEAEEVLCDWFRDYMVDQVYGKSWTQRIKNFFRMLFHLSKVSYENLTDASLNIFCNAMKGKYSKPYLYRSTYNCRVLEYKLQGMSWDEIFAAEDKRSAYESRTEEEKDMLREAGITQFAFDILSPKSRDELIDCL